MLCASFYRLRFLILHAHGYLAPQVDESKQSMLRDTIAGILKNARFTVRLSPLVLWRDLQISLYFSAPLCFSLSLARFAIAICDNRSISPAHHSDNATLCIRAVAIRGIAIATSPIARNVPAIRIPLARALLAPHRTLAHESISAM